VSALVATFYNLLAPANSNEYKSFVTSLVVMIFVFAAWACMLLAVGLAWLWLQSQPAPRRGVNCARDDSHARATRTTLRSLALLSTLSMVLLMMHFLMPAREAQTDVQWAAHANVTDANHTPSANLHGRTVHANRSEHTNHTQRN